MWMKPAERAHVARRGGEVGQRAQGEVDLQHTPFRAVAADAREVARLELDRIDQSEHRAARIGVRHDGLRAASSSPDASVTPVARPIPSRRCDRRRRPTRISTPAARAAPASAEVNAPRPPRTSRGLPSPALIRISSTAVLPAERGPSAVPKMPPAAMAARNGSDSNHSDTKSAADIGAQRKQPVRVFFPKPPESAPHHQHRPQIVLPTAARFPAAGSP